MARRTSFQVTEPRTAWLGPVTMTSELWRVQSHQRMSPATR